MKKVALVSVHNDPNFGSALQAYALAYAIQREGYECEYLNYTLEPAPDSIKCRSFFCGKGLFFHTLAVCTVHSIDPDLVALIDEQGHHKGSAGLEGALLEGV